MAVGWFSAGKPTTFTPVSFTAFASEEQHLRIHPA
jgi:hypothetical protein